MRVFKEKKRVEEQNPINTVNASKANVFFFANARNKKNLFAYITINIPLTVHELDLVGFSIEKQSIIY